MKKLIAFALALTIHTSTLAACICLDAPPLHVEISAAYPQPLEGESEWVELMNIGDQIIDLRFYTLEDSTAKPMNLEGEIPPGESLKITNLTFQLNNGEDSLTLETIDGIYVHSFSYSESKEGLPVPLSEEPMETLEAPSRWPDFSEALPNPEGTDTTEEWIEIYNPFDEELSLSGLLLDDQEGGSKPYGLSGTIAPYEYYLISVEDSGLNLNNTTDEIRLLFEETELWNVPYKDVEEGLSYAYINGSYEWTTPSPAKPNISLNSDDNGDLSEEVELSEIQPNPEGPDQDNEWIEITNGGDTTVDLGNWTIDDGPNGSAPYTIPAGTLINPGETLILDRPTTEIALNNSHERIELKDFTGELMDQISYESTQEGKSLSKIEIEEESNLQASLNPMNLRSETRWEWTEPTPGEQNPKWKQLTGTVESFEESTLKLKEGQSLEVTHSSFNELLFKPGNTLLIQASMGNGFARLINAEMLNQVHANESNQTPWSWILLSIFATTLMAYEWKKHSEKNSIFLPHSKLVSH